MIKFVQCVRRKPGLSKHELGEVGFDRSEIIVLAGPSSAAAADKPR